MRTGIGYDAHRLVSGRKLILGGVEIPYELGLEGHSDADVLSHAIADALLGAAGLGDIGQWFPDTDIQYKGISSLLLLERVAALLSENGYRIGNVDSVIIMQKPKVSAYYGEMRKNIGSALCIEEDNVSVKASSTEKMGFEGRGEGVSVQAVAVIFKR